jgi:hypothetical protein
VIGNGFLVPRNNVRCAPATFERVRKRGLLHAVRLWRLRNSFCQSFVRFLHRPTFLIVQRIQLRHLNCILTGYKPYLAVPVLGAPTRVATDVQIFRTSATPYVQPS